MYSPDQGIVHLKQRAEAGDPEAQNLLGRRYAQGDAVRQDATLAERWFRAAAQQGLLKARHNLAVLKLRSAAPDAEKAAIALFTEAAEAGWVNSMVALGTIHADRGERDAAVQWLERACTLDDPIAQDLLSEILIQDEHDAAALERAHRLAMRAAARNVSSAQARLGTIYHEGLGVLRDPAVSFAWFMKAAGAGHPGAQLMVGVHYDMGGVVQVDRVASATWLMRAQRGGHTLAAAYLARVLRGLTEAELADVRQRAAAPLQ